MFWLDLVGTIASVLGLGVSLYVLGVAKDVRDAVAAAQVVARRRNLAEELDQVSSKLQQLGNFLQQEEWVAVQIRIDEILAICKMAATRWSDHLSMEHLNGVLTAVTLIQSIATRSAEVSGREVSPAEKKRLTRTHLTASGLINSARGEVRREEERNGGNDGD
jgi:hypothetical protein